MRYLVLACDFDGTLATDGRVDDTVLAALGRFRASGRKLVLVTGRHLDDLSRVFPHLPLFDRLVAENGALLYRPATREEKPLGPAPPPVLLQALREKGVLPLSSGRVIIATSRPHEGTVLEAIRNLGLEYQVIFNKGSVMILPTGVNKATGLRAALAEIGLSPHNAVGIGDAENDHALLDLCECGAAVANALPVIKDRADVVTEGSSGAGVTELMDRIIAADLQELDPLLTRRHILLGKREDGEEIFLSPYAANVLIAGTSGSGKSTLATGLLERLMEREYQVSIVDPEGDYSGLKGAVVLGDSHAPPGIPEMVKILDQPDQNVVVNLMNIAREGRPAFLEELLPHFQEIRTRTGRPHWIVLDETHHLLPETRDPAAQNLPREIFGTLLITVHPEHVAPAVLAPVNAVIAVGEAPDRVIRSFCGAVGRIPPGQIPGELEAGEALFWSVADGRGPVRFRSIPPEAERLRHRRKYAAGELSPGESFYFRGPEGKLNLRAQNLMIFLQIADGLDDATWLHHLQQGDYSQWFRRFIKDEELAAEAEKIEQDGLSAEKSRRRIREEIEKRYTAPP